MSQRDAGVAENIKIYIPKAIAEMEITDIKEGDYESSQ